MTAPFVVIKSRLADVTSNILAGLRRALLALGGPAFWRAVVPGLVPLVYWPFLVPLVRAELNEPLFGDTAAFQYAAWCIRHGMRLYRDVGMADGPFIYYLQAAMQMVAGPSDRGFRVVDLFLQGLCAGVIGLTLAPAVDLPRAGRLLQRLAWAGLCAATWLAWYLGWDWTTTTERDLYYVLFGATGISLLWASGSFGPRAATAAAFAGGLLLTSLIFGKPTGVVYAFVGASCLLLEAPGSTVSRASRLRWAAIGAVTCVVLVVLALATTGSFSGYFFWCVTIPYRGNMFLFRFDPRKFLWGPGWEPFREMALLSLIGGSASVATGVLPRRALGPALLPAVLFASAVAQGRGYLYQVAPVSGATTLFLLLVLTTLWGERPQAPGRKGVLATVALAFVAWHFFTTAYEGPYVWKGDQAQWTSSTHQVAPVERQVGEYLKAHTKPDDTLFVYGGDAHAVLYAAERRTASPFFHSFWLDPIGLLPMTENQPNADERAALEALQTETRRRACAAITKALPAGIAFNRLSDVLKICPPLQALLAQDYVDTMTIGAFHIHLRKAAGL